MYVCVRKKGGGGGGGRENKNKGGRMENLKFVRHGKVQSEGESMIFKLNLERNIFFHRYID